MNLYFFLSICDFQMVLNWHIKLNTEINILTTAGFSRNLLYENFSSPKR